MNLNSDIIQHSLKSLSSLSQIFKDLVSDPTRVIPQLQICLSHFQTLTYFQQTLQQQPFSITPIQAWSCLPTVENPQKLLPQISIHQNTQQNQTIQRLSLQCKQQQSLIDFLKKIQNSKTNRIKEISHKYQKAAASLQLKKSENSQLQRKTQRLKLLVKQLKSRLIAQHKPSQEILGAIYFENLNLEQEPIQTYKTNSYQQDIYNQQLVCLVQNLHLKIKYCKEQINSLKATNKGLIKQLSNSKVEKTQADKQINQLKKELKQIHQQIVRNNFKIKTSIELREQVKIQALQAQQAKLKQQILQYKSNEHSKLVKHKQTYQQKVSKLQTDHQKMIEYLSKFHQQRVEKLQNYYQSQIHQIAQDASRQQAKFYSDLNDLKSAITHQQTQTVTLSNALFLQKAKFLQNSHYLNLSKTKIQQLQKQYLNTQQNWKLQKSQHQAFLRQMNEHMASYKAQMRAFHDRFVQKSKAKKKKVIQALQTRLTNKRVSLQNELAFQIEKAATEQEKLKETYIKQIKALAKEKNQIQQEAQQKLKTQELQAAQRLVQYQKLISVEKETIVESLNRQREELASKLKQQMIEMQQQMITEKSEAIERIQDQSNKKLTEMAVKHDKHIISIQTAHKQDVNFLNQRLEKLTKKSEKTVEEFNKNIQELHLNYKNEFNRLSDQNRTLLDIKKRLEIEKIRDLDIIQNLQKSIKENRVIFQQEIKRKTQEINQLTVKSEQKLNKKNQQFSQLWQTQKENLQAESNRALQYVRQHYQQKIQTLQQLNSELKKSVNPKQHIVQNHPITVRVRQELQVSKRKIKELNSEIAALKTVIRNMDENEKIFSHSRGSSIHRDSPGFQAKRRKYRDSIKLGLNRSII